MRLPRHLLPALALGCPLLLAATASAAQTVIHRCTGSDGRPVFTDRACVDVHATPNRPPPRASPPDAQTSGYAAPPPILCAANVEQLKQGVADAFAARDANRLAGLMLWGGYGHSAVVEDIRSLRRLLQKPLLEVTTAAADDTGSTEANAGDDGDAPLPPDVATGAAAGGWSVGTAAPPARMATQAEPAVPRELTIRTESSDGSGAPHITRFTLARRSGCVWLRPR